MIRFTRLSLVTALALTLAPYIAVAQGTVLGLGSKAQTVGQSATNPQGSLKFPVVGGVSSVDSTGRPLLFDANGNLRTAEGSPIMSSTSGFFLLIDDTTAVGMADSSSVQTLYANYIVHGFWVRVQAPAGRATPYVRMAFQVRTHLNSTADSLSTGPVQLRRANGGQTTATDTLSIGQVGAPTAVALGPDEIPVTISRSDAVAAKWTVGPMQYIPVALSNGDAVRLPNFSVRVRNLDSGATGGTARVTVYAYCTAIR